jgi:hypothetical protein
MAMRQLRRDRRGGGRVLRDVRAGQAEAVSLVRLPKRALRSALFVSRLLAMVRRRGEWGGAYSFGGRAVRGGWELKQDHWSD